MTPHPPASLHAPPGPRPPAWLLAPEGAAVDPAGRTAVIADVHLGYDWARAARGDMVPPHALAEALAKLERLLARATIERLVVAGDLVESPRPCARTARDVARLGAWLGARGVELLALPGNHDRRGRGPATVEVAGWTIGHGHEPIDGSRVVMGHHHPVLRAGGAAVPCFLVGPSMLVLPAFTENAAGVHVASLGWPGDPRAEGLRCLAPVDGDWLDFGPLDALRAGLARAPARS